MPGPFAVPRAPPSARRFLQAPLALKLAKQPMTPVFLTPLLAQLKITSLLGRNPTVLQVKGKSRTGRAYSLRRTLPMVPIF